VHGYTGHVVRVARFGLLGLAGVAGILAAVLLAASPAGADDGTTPTATAPTTTTPTTPTETTPTTPVPPAPRTIKTGVAIAGQDVGGLTAAEARAAVEKRFRRSLLLVVSPQSSRRVTPGQLGARALVDKAVSSAVATRTPGRAIPLTVEVDDGVLRRYLARLGRQTSAAPVDSELKLVRLKPVWTRSKPGRRLQELRQHSREPFVLPYAERAPAVTEEEPGKVIVVRRESKQLRLYDGTRLKRIFRVATGQSSYPTPLGRWVIVNKQRNPWWYPPQTSAWAAGKEPVPPGPGNPLGTRWMGLSAPLVGIHGTPDSASIGYSASHGCIRMLIPEVEWLFERVDIGTTVFIVPA
jgi:lipoprotein-anchoring transpeptidase ErfK/SrfK